MAETLNAAQDLNPWGQRIDTLRRAAGLTWADVWRRVGIDRAQGRKYVRADNFNVPGPDRVAKIAAVLNVDPAEIEPTPKQPRPTAQAETRRLGAEVEALWREIQVLRDSFQAQTSLSEALLDEFRSLKDDLRQRRRSDGPR